MTEREQKLIRRAQADLAELRVIQARLREQEREILAQLGDRLARLEASA
jgi:hypothetical protein